LAAQRLGAVHADQRPEAEGDGGGLCQVPQPAGGAWPPGPGGPAVCLRRRLGAVVVPLGAAGLPQSPFPPAPLPGTAPGAHAHLHARPAAAAAVRGHRLGAAERVGVAARGGAGPAAAGWAPRLLGALASAADAAVAATCR